MNLFYKRPLSLILCVMLGGFALFSLCGIAVRITVASLSVIVFILSFFIKKQEKSKIILTRILSIALLACITLSYLYFNNFFIYKSFEGEITIKGEVTDKNFESFNKIADVKTEEINNRRKRGYKLKVYFDDEQLYDLNVGETIVFKATLSSFENYDNSFDTEVYYTSKGYSALASEANSVTVTESGAPRLSYKINAYRKALTDRIVSHSDNRSGGLLSALLTGDRSALSPALSLSFSRIGITHILALSGMHIVILGFAIERLLSLFKVNKKGQKIGVIVFAILYMAFTGFPVSVVRAGLMTIIASLLFLVASERDSVTNLFISVAIICLVEPYSVFDLSLWLSALSTLGVILVNELNEKRRIESGKISKGFLHYIKNSLLISLFAIVSTLAITICSFKEISLISPFATLVFSLLTEIYMYIGLVFIPLCGLIPMGKIIVFFGNFISNFASWISSFHFLFASADFIYIRILAIALTTAFFLFAILNVKHKKSAIAVLSSTFVLISLSAAISTSVCENRLAFSYLRSADDEFIFTSSDGESLMIDISTVNATDSRTALNYISDRKITNLEKYVYTRYSSSLCTSANTLLKNLLIEELYIPTPTNEKEESLASDLQKLCEEYRTKLVLYNDTDIIICDSFSVFPQFYVSDEYEKKNALAILYEDEFYTYVSSGLLKGKYALGITPLIYGCDTLILGSKGRAYSDYRFEYKLDNLDELIISSDGVILTEAALEYYSETEIKYSPQEVSFIR